MGRYSFAGIEAKLVRTYNYQRNQAINASDKAKFDLKDTLDGKSKAIEDNQWHQVCWEEFVSTGKF